ncbi:hypothetical protein B0H34DRAFT_703300 [Crassisporium funariophilum]|nr:hypothetical protein B0H34DRAFT_703300 [Crassisporium funariophilum]
MSATRSDSFNPKTYGKRSSIKRKQLQETPAPVRAEESAPSPSVAAKKRRKVSVEPLLRHKTPSETEDVLTDVELSPPRKPKVHTTYASPQRPDSGRASPKLVSVAPTSPAGRPSKPARDLSQIFESISPLEARSLSPTKLAKRMLARSKTESSIESQTSTHDIPIDRTPSLPNLPSSSPPKSHNEVASGSKASMPVLPPLLPTSSSTTRTYAGKFRSFLVTLPAPATSSNINSQNIAGEDDEFDTRESYSSLRTRWGVDNSEDDPYPYASPSPTKSNATTPNISPVRNSKGQPKNLSAPTRPPPIPTGMMNPLKSISELRNRGESRRFLDEVGYLFEGMDKDGGIGLRRASALQITIKLCDPEFARKAKAVDFCSRTWDVFLEAGAGKGDDQILDTLIIFFAALVARDSSTLSDLANRTSSSPPPSAIPNPKGKDQEIDQGQDSFVECLSRLLSTLPPDVDPLLLVAPDSDVEESELKRLGISKKDMTIFTTIYKTIRSKSNLFSPDTRISTPLLISYTLQSLPPSLIPSTHLPTLLISLRSSLTTSSRFDSLTTSLNLKWRDAADAIPYETVYFHLRLLDTYLLNQWETPPMNDNGQRKDEGNNMMERNESVLNTARDEWLVDDLIALGICTEIKVTEDESRLVAIQKCMETTLRVLVSLTHADEVWGRKVVQSNCAMGFILRTTHKFGRYVNQSSLRTRDGVKLKIEDGEDTTDPEGINHDRPETHSLDTLCLALGLLTNLVQVVDEAKQALRITYLNPFCPLKKRTCARKCTCSSLSSGLDILVNLYTQQQTKTESLPSAMDSPEADAEADASFLRGHLAVLFGLLMSGSAENQSLILASLPNLSATAALNTRAMKDSNRAKLSRLVEQARDFVAFYSVVSRNSAEGEKESKVARRVVRFLETQRDATV